MTRLKHERIKRDMTQQDLGSLTGISYADISRIETLRMKPYVKHIQALEKFFSLTIKELLSEIA